MAQQIQLTREGNQIKVITPYHANFVHKCRNFRGHFTNGAWWFDESIIDHVREAMITYFGTTGEVPYDTCILEIKNFTQFQERAPVEIFGKVVAKSFNRNFEPKLGDDIVLICGIVKTTGSVKNWRVEVLGAHFEIHNFPVPSLSLPDVQLAIKTGWCTVKPYKKRRDPEDIKREISALRSRISDLEKDLENVG